MPDATRPPGFNEFLWNSLSPEIRNEIVARAAAEGISADNWVSRNSSSSGFGSGFSGNWGAGGGNVAGIPGLSYDRFRAAVLAGAAGSVGAGIAGAGAGGAGSGGFVSGTGAGGTLGSTGGFWGSFGGQALLNAGLNLAGGYLQGRAINKANSANIDAMKDRIKQALQQLSPEQIQLLMRQFLPQIAAVNNPLQQTALQGLATSQARQGLAGTPYGLTAEAGLRGQFANNMSTQAFQQAMGLAGQRASAVTGAPFVQTQPNLGLANAFSNTADQTLLAYALSRRNQPPVTPYTMNQGGPAPWEIQQTEGTPYRWPFNPGRY